MTLIVAILAFFLGAMSRRESVDAMAESIEQMRPVYEAAIEWREADREMEHGDKPSSGERFRLAWDALNEAVDTALAHRRGVVNQGRPHDA